MPNHARNIRSVTATFDLPPEQPPMAPPRDSRRLLTPPRKARPYSPTVSWETRSVGYELAHANADQLQQIPPTLTATAQTQATEWSLAANPSSC
jgi:hypothetical protein